MAQLAPITLGSATFAHVKTSPTSVMYAENVAATVPSIAAATLSISWSLEASKSVYKVKLAYAKPTLTVPPSGSIAKPTIAYVTRSTNEYFLPVVGTSTERAAAQTQMRAAEALAVVTTLVQNLIPANL